ncbi:hypothetical protein PTKIN_Ptkin14bG0124900 [Pterospermum kingtungense]
MLPREFYVSASSTRSQVGEIENSKLLVWAVLKPRFLALLEDPFDTKLLDIIVFDVLPVPTSNEDAKSQVHLADQIKERNLCAMHSRPEGWCYPHCFGSFAPPRGLNEDESQAQWFIDDIHNWPVALPRIVSEVTFSKSHHEELVIVDYQIIFIGRLDLCFGRYDTVEHRVTQWNIEWQIALLIYGLERTIIVPESEPNSSEESMKDELERGKYPCMPWHDVHCALWGTPCCDVARLFVQRWNHAKGEINQKDLSRQDSFPSRSPFEDIPLLCIPSRWSRTLRGCLNGGVEEVVFLKIPNGWRSLNLSKFESWYIL